MSDRYHDESAVSNRSTAADSPSLLLLSCQFRGAFSLSSLAQTRTIFYLKRFFEFRPSLREREKNRFVMDNHWKDSRLKRGRRDGLDSVCIEKSRSSCHLKLLDKRFALLSDFRFTVISPRYFKAIDAPRRNSAARLRSSLARASSGGGFQFLGSINLQRSR